MDVGLDERARERIRAAHSEALSRNLMHIDSYGGSNASEFWAESAQAWFDASVRCDVNCGLNTREEIRARAPLIACELEEAFGDGDWRYSDALDEFAPQRRKYWELVDKKRSILRHAWGRLRRISGYASHRGTILEEAQRAQVKIPPDTSSSSNPGLASGSDAADSENHSASERWMPEENVQNRRLTRHSRALCEACAYVVEAAERKGLPWD